MQRSKLVVGEVVRQGGGARRGVQPGGSARELVAARSRAAAWAWPSVLSVKSQEQSSLVLSSRRVVVA